jgi:hypothetical protein
VFVNAVKGVFSKNMQKSTNLDCGALDLFKAIVLEWYSYFLTVLVYLRRIYLIRREMSRWNINGLYLALTFRADGL